MPNYDKAVSKKPRESEEDKDEAATLALCDLACALAQESALRKSAFDHVQENPGKRQDAAKSQDVTDPQNSLHQQEIDFHKLIKRNMHQKKDEVLYDAIARSEAMSRDASLFLKRAIEETAEITVIERAEGNMMEINAFVIPLFLHTTGGLEASRCFQDQEAFELLGKSLQSEGLESKQATVVLVNHGYHINEIDSITYSHLHAMLRDAFHAMTDKRSAATAAIDRSISGWPDSPFSADDRAIELRFLLGFSLKAVDDPFYAEPEDEAASDAYFEAREKRFQHWTVEVLPLIQRCFAIDQHRAEAEAEDDVHFLYQDLFHAGKEHGIAEYFTLQLISELNRGLQSRGLQSPSAAAAGIQAVIGPIDSAGEAVLKIQLFDASNILIMQTEKPVPALPDWETEFADTCNALTMIGINHVSIAKKFTIDGQALDATPYAGVIAE